MSYFIQYSGYFNFFRVILSRPACAGRGTRRRIPMREALIKGILRRFAPQDDAQTAYVRRFFPIEIL
ncbi:hypothetical protein A2Y83_04330 [Candidatus Falkowbacteria bacterium RBG_13_39_14]|uniref:Uncharacterized protein n=1 Tax=Candidatus Falkowbacteria bacterium RBG_13_39_14 TaxID=1797985 RepID=A0A1F5S3U6_9BACT|nr:MAG: hypothetical protein A2Y83_04330 [Candidatus Falkowbacteria bacterium RBG_13_39_14]